MQTALIEIFSQQADSTTSGYLECKDCQTVIYFRRGTEDTLQALRKHGIDIHCNKCGERLNPVLLPRRRSF